jgi:hypothetical protein
LPQFPFYGIQGVHTYTNTGHYTITATVTDQNGNSTTVTSQATVALENTLSPPSSDLATVGIETNLPLGTFTAPQADANASDFTATIDWGDGTTSTGVVSMGTPSDGVGTPPEMIVTGTHTYDRGASYEVHVTITDGNTLVATGVANVLVEPSDPLPPIVAPITVVDPPVAVPPGGGSPAPIVTPITHGTTTNGGNGLVVPAGPVALSNGDASLFSAKLEHKSAGHAKKPLPHPHLPRVHPKPVPHHVVSVAHHLARTVKHPG